MDIAVSPYSTQKSLFSYMQFPSRRKFLWPISGPFLYLRQPSSQSHGPSWRAIPPFSPSLSFFQRLWNTFYRFTVFYLRGGASGSEGCCSVRYAPRAPSALCAKTFRAHDSWVYVAAASAASRLLVRMRWLFPPAGWARSLPSGNRVPAVRVRTARTRFAFDESTHRLNFRDVRDHHASQNFFEK